TANDPRFPQMKEEVLHLVLEEGIEAVREIYKISFSIPPTTDSFYLKCLRMEIEHNPNDQTLLRNLFEKAIYDHGDTSAEIWKEYILWERSMKEFQRSVLVFSRARKTLDDPTSFVNDFAMME